MSALAFQFAKKAIPVTDIVTGKTGSGGDEMSVGSYILGSPQQQRMNQDIDEKTAASRILKMLAERPVTANELASLTNFPETVVNTAVMMLLQQRYVEFAPDRRLVLTGMGEKAQFVVAS